MAKVRIEYDCPACFAKTIHSEEREINVDIKVEFLRFVAHQVVCQNPKCPSEGWPQDLKATRVVPA